MEGYMVHGPIAMTSGSLARIEDGRGVRVEVWDGGLWITQHADARDYFIGPGGSLTLDRDGVAIVHALGRTQLTLTADVPAFYAKRVTLMEAGAAAPRVLYDRSNERCGLLAGLGHRLTRLWLNAYSRTAVPTTAGL